MTRPPLLRASYDLLPDELVVEPRELGRFLPGRRYSLATEIAPGERRSTATEFKPGGPQGAETRFRSGQPAHNHVDVGTVRVRRETHTGLLRAWVKVAEPSVWRKRAVVVWEAAHGRLPFGSVVHHEDRDSLNDDLNNLRALTRSEHTTEHRRELAEAAWRAFQ